MWRLGGRRPATKLNPLPNDESVLLEAAVALARDTSQPDVETTPDDEAPMRGYLDIQARRTYYFG